MVGSLDEHKRWAREEFASFSKAELIDYVAFLVRKNERLKGQLADYRLMYRKAVAK